MNRWLIDASVLLAREDTDDPRHQDARHLMQRGDTLLTIDLAYYEVTNVAIRAWNDLAAASRLQAAINGIAGAGGLVRCDRTMVGDLTTAAAAHRLSAYDAAYVAAAAAVGARLVSCDVKDLVSNGLAVLPAQALAESEAAGSGEPPPGGAP